MMHGQKNIKPVKNLKRQFCNTVIN